MAVTAPLRISMILPLIWFPVLNFMSAMSSSPPASAEIAAEALDAAAGFFERLDPGRVGNAEEGREPERRAMHHGHALLFEQRGGEILVMADLLAAARGLGDHAGA